MKLRIGPGAFVAAAFIGPGTVTTATLAGANFGYVLIWALVFATVATMVLQDMSARLGVAGRLGLGEALVRSAGSAPIKWAIGSLVFAALMIGNIAYEGGNLGGGALGVSALLGENTANQNMIVLALALVAGIILIIGEYKWLERTLIALVLIMCAAFIFGAIIVAPSLSGLAYGLVPRIPTGAEITVIALIGTTIVPYNLFLHAAAARQKWQGAYSLSEARWDSGFSIGFGGLVSILIVATAATTLFKSGADVKNASDMARAIEPAFGSAARYFVGIGLLAAGLTSAITAPMATGYALSELIGGDEAARKKWFKVTALIVLVVGAGLNLGDIDKTELILIAQFANGLLLPVIGVFLLWVMNRSSLLGEHVNGRVSNIVGGAAVLITFVLGLRSILRALGVM